MIESEYNDGMTPLHRAAIDGNLDEVTRLLSGADAKALAREMNGQLEYPLYSALFLGSVNTLTLIAKKEAIFRKLLPYSLDKLDHQNRMMQDTVLHRVVKNGFGSLLNDILSKKENDRLLLIKNSDGSAPIHVAVLNGRLGIVKRILEKQGMSALMDSQGNLPLHLAAGYRSLDMVKACLAAYPEGINISNQHHKTPLDLAKSSNFPEVQAYLIEQGATIDPTEGWFDTQVSSHL